MWYIAIDVTCSVVCLYVCLSVCWTHGWALQKRLNRSRCRLGRTRVGQRNLVLDGVEMPHGKGQLLGLSGLLISIASLLRTCGIRSKRDHSILNNGTTCGPVFRQNFWPTCCFSIFYIPSHCDTTTHITMRLSTKIVQCHFLTRSQRHTADKEDTWH